MPEVPDKVKQKILVCLPGLYISPPSRTPRPGVSGKGKEAIDERGLVKAVHIRFENKRIKKAETSDQFSLLLPGCRPLVANVIISKSKLKCWFLYKISRLLKPSKTT